MRLVGWSEEWDKAEGLTPVALSDIDFHASPEELRALAEFFMSAAEEAEKAIQQGCNDHICTDFPNPNPRAAVPLTVSVVPEVAAPVTAPGP